MALVFETAAVLAGCGSRVRAPTPPDLARASHTQARAHGAATFGRPQVEHVGLGDKARAKLRTLSGGMLRRVGIAQAIVAVLYAAPQIGPPGAPAVVPVAVGATAVAAVCALASAAGP